MAKAKKKRSISRPRSTDAFSNSSGSLPGSRSQSKEKLGSKHSSSNLDKKKKKIVKTAYYSGMSAAEKEKVEKAIKLLDHHLVLLRTRKCYQRRLRAVLDYENPYRSNALHSRGKALLLQIKKDSKGPKQTIEVKNNQNLDYYEFRKSGGLLLQHFSIRDIQSINFELFQLQNSLVIDMLQSFVQSIVLAGRAGEHNKVLKFAKTFWNTYRYLIFVGKLNAEFWRITFWKSLLVIGESILTSLGALRILRQNNDNIFISYDESKFEDVKKGKLKLKSTADLYQGKFIANWNDRLGNSQIHHYDLPFCAEFLLFTVEMLNAAGMVHRLQMFAKQVHAYFDNAYSYILVPLLKITGDQIAGLGTKEVRPTAVLGHSSVSQIRCTARHLSAKIIAQSNDVVIAPNLAQEDVEMCLDLYNEAIKLSQVENPALQASLCLEVGDFLFSQKRYAASTSFWTKGLDQLVGQSNFVQNWRSILSLHPIKLITPADCVHSVSKFGGSYHAIMAANTLCKIARFTYINNHDKQVELLWLSSNIIYAAMSLSFGGPLTYVQHSEHFAEDFVQKTNIFSDKFQIDALQFIENIQFMAFELTQVEMGVICLPMLNLAESICTKYLDSALVVNSILCLKAEVLAQIGCVNESFSYLEQIAKSTFTNKREEPQNELVFDNSIYPFSIGQFQSIRSLLTLTISDKVISQNPLFHNEFELCKARIILSLFTWADKNQYCFLHHNKDNAVLSKSDLNKDYLMWSTETLDLLKISLQSLISNQQLAIKGNENSKDSKEFDYLLHVNLVLASDLYAKTMFAKKHHKEALKWFFFTLILGLCLFANILPR